MKNILILDTGKEWGGGTNSLLELLRRIDKKKYNFTALFYYNYPMSEMSDIKTEIEKLGINFILFKRTGQPIYIKILKEIGRAVLFFNRRLRKLYIFWIDYLFRIKKDAEGLTKLLNDLSIDVLYMNNQPSSNLEGIIAAKNTGIKSLLHSRIETELNYFEINIVNRWLTKMICNSEGVKNNFVKQGIEPSKCVVIYNGIALGTKPHMPSHEIRKRWRLSNDDILIGTVGSLIKRKRIKDLIKAFFIVANRTEHPIKCMIVGEGPEKENLISLVKKTNLTNKFIFTGFQDGISYINAMDIFVLTSEKEGFSKVILEAMLMGKPVVSSDIIGPSELVVDKETGFLVTMGKINMIANAILKLVNSDEMRRYIGGRARKRAIENFSIERYVNQVSDVLAEVAG